MEHEEAYGSLWKHIEGLRSLKNPNLRKLATHAPRLSHTRRLLSRLSQSQYGNTLTRRAYGTRVECYVGYQKLV